MQKELGFILRHSGWTHADKSLSVFELIAGARQEEEPVFPAIKGVSNFVIGANTLRRPLICSLQLCITKRAGIRLEF